MSSVLKSMKGLIGFGGEEKTGYLTTMMNFIFRKSLDVAMKVQPKEPKPKSFLNSFNPFKQAEPQPQPQPQATGIWEAALDFIVTQQVSNFIVVFVLVAAIMYFILKRRLVPM